jgi:hypothetical protein
MFAGTFLVPKRVAADSTGFIEVLKCIGVPDGI